MAQTTYFLAGNLKKIVIKLTYIWEGGNLEGVWEKNATEFFEYRTESWDLASQIFILRAMERIGCKHGW